MSQYQNSDASTDKIIIIIQHSTHTLQHVEMVLVSTTKASNVEHQILGVKCDASKGEIIIIVHHEHRNMQKRSCRLSTRFCQYIGHRAVGKSENQGYGGQIVMRVP